jgi:hypothetical protein
MAVKYLDSAAGGTASGDDWTNAYTSYSSVTLSAAGDIVYIASGHSDSSDNTIQGVAAGAGQGVIHASVDKTGSVPPVNADLLAGAVLTSSSVHYNINDSCYLYGFELQANTNDRDIVFNPDRETIVLEDMTLTPGRDGGIIVGGQSSRIYAYNTTIDSLSGTTLDNLGGFESVGSVNGGEYHWFGGQVDATGLQYRDWIVYGGIRSRVINYYGFDFSNWGVTGGTVGINGVASEEGTHRFFFCKFPHTASSFGLGTSITSGQGRIECVGCGLVDNTSQEQGLIHDQYGDMEVWGGGLASRAVYRSGGATPPHQTNPISWEVIPTSRCGIQWGFRLFPIMKYYATTGSTITIKIHYLLDDASAVAALDDSQIVMHIHYFDATGVQIGYENTFPGVLGTLGGETNHSVESGETWTTTNAPGGTTEKYSMSHTTASTIAQEGFVQVVLEVKDIGTNDRVFIDPKMEIT